MAVVTPHPPMETQTVKRQIIAVGGGNTRSVLAL